MTYIAESAIVGPRAQIEGRARILGMARVVDTARVRDAEVVGLACIGGTAEVLRTTDYLVLGPLGSVGRMVTFYRTREQSIGVNAGCFAGTIDELRQQVEVGPDWRYSPWSDRELWAEQYEAAIELAEEWAVINEWARKGDNE